MKKKLNIVIEFPLLNKDFNRFGIKYLSKKFEVEIIDISNLTNKDMSNYEYTDPYIHNMKKDFILNKVISIRELFKFINRNKNKLTIDYLSDKPVNELIRYVMYFSKLKLIKTSHGMHPTQLPNYKQFEFYLKKIFSISAWINLPSSPPLPKFSINVSIQGCSHSRNAVVLKPSFLKPRAKPPHPAKRSITFIFKSHSNLPRNCLS